MTSCIERSEDLVERMAGENTACIISFSRGKDSIAAYLAIRERFENVVPYFYTVVPGLEFVEESLAYYEKLMGRRILRFTSPGYYSRINSFMYQPPDTIAMIQALGLVSHSHDDIQMGVCSDEGLDYETTYNALGMRAKDSMQRALYFQKNGPVNHTRKLFYPVWDWDKQRVVDAIRRSGWKLPIDYKYFSASFDGIYLKYLLPIKQHFPRDWEKIITIFPLAELEILRYEASLK